MARAACLQSLHSLSHASNNGPEAFHPGTERSCVQQELSVMPAMSLSPFHRRRNSVARTERKPSRFTRLASLQLEALEDRSLLSVSTFAQFLELNPAAQSFVYTDNGTSADFNT